eukprot:COSAG06_NODE_139_length_22328_cov_53.042107_2_plen_259_part_00
MQPAAAQIDHPRGWGPRGGAVVLASSTASADFVPSPSTDESLSSKTLSHGDAAAAAPSFSSLPNPSNYGFLNATTQCLRHTPHLAPNICAAAPYVTRAPFPFVTHTAFRPCSHPCPKCSSHTLWYGPIACDCHWQVGSDDSQARRRSAPRCGRDEAGAEGRVLALPLVLRRPRRGRDREFRGMLPRDGHRAPRRASCRSDVILGAPRRGHAERGGAGVRLGRPVRGRMGQLRICYAPACEFWVLLVLVLVILFSSRLR